MRWLNYTMITIISSASKRGAVFSLYARILRLHRAKLPEEMRRLGDSYVRCVAAVRCFLALCNQATFTRTRTICNAAQG